MVAPVSAKNFEAMCATLGHPEWKTDPRFARVIDREQNWDALMRLMEAWTGVRSGAEAEAVLLAAEVPCARYRSIEEAMAEPHLAQRGTLERLGPPDESYLVANMPARFSRSRTRARPLVPQLDEHARQVLDDWLR
jgi:crotonobetainyl-CoA:carnitine CoA-transferase CaiB-like acyl-CoA transferase